MIRRPATVCVLLVVGVSLACRGRSAPPEPPELSSVELLAAAPEEGFARAEGPRTFAFPADHGPHPGFRTEWWYLTGNLESGAGRPFGYQLTFFRNALAADAPERSSAWAADEAFMAHFAVTDVRGGALWSFERFQRAALGLAGARGAPLRVWLEDWELAAAGEEAPPFRLRAAAEGVELALTLEAAKPPVLHGEGGLSRKGERPGNASYYYSYTRMPSGGRLRLGGESFAVRGTSWMDREWSTSALEPDQAGWDWFALQLDDGRELMFYRLRRRGGGSHPASEGSLVDRQGERRRLTLGDVELTVLDRWTSPASGAVYPARWRLTVPAAELELRIEPLLADQELRHAFRYWEGAVRAAGESAGRPVAGEGYVELTGY